MTPVLPITADFAATGGAIADRLRALLPQSLFSVQILDVSLVQWIGLALLVLGASLVAYMASTVAIRSLGSLANRTSTTWDDRFVRDVAGPLRLGLAVLLFYLGTQFLGLHEAALHVVDVAATVLGVIAVTWLVLRLTDTTCYLLQARFEEQNPVATKTLVPLGRRITKTFLVAIAVLSLLQNLGFNITGVMAGLGVGGLAVALAAQKTLENLFGGVVIIADRPVKVGDFCRAGEHTGTVEEIGMRSTRLRTLDRTLVSIPNAEFSTVRIENYGARDRMRLYTILQVGYDTTPDQMRWLLVELRKMLYAHPMTHPEPCRVRFVNFGAHSLDLEVFVYVKTADWNEFLGVREDIFLRIHDIVAKSGTYFAYPSQTLYLGRDGGRDPERSRAAEEEARGWIERNELPLPAFPAERIAAIDDTLPWPPEGAATAEHEESRPS